MPFANRQVAADVTVYDAGNVKTGVERKVTILGPDLTLKATGTVTADGGQRLIERDVPRRDRGDPPGFDARLSGTDVLIGP